MTLISLPIDTYIASITASSAPNIILTATPGSGKTTRVPPALAIISKKRVLCVEPRRLACIAAASRIADETGQSLGKNIGYHVRMEKKCRQDTKLCFVTTGMLLQYLCSDPFLEDISMVIFDEFHERSIDADIALAMCRYLQTEAGNDLRIVIMSATLDTKSIANYLPDADMFNIDSPIYPLEIQNIEQTTGSRFSDYADVLFEACETALEKTTGDILTFQPGIGDIQAAIDMAKSKYNDRYEYLPCHASLSLDEQKNILLPQSSKRRIIFSTNVAESSLTIPRVSTVIDTGYAKRKFFDSVSGLSKLETLRISKASADQRAGRAARLGPGLCIRLWSTFTHNQLEDQTAPEIERLDLSQAYLQICAWSLEKPESLPLLSKPCAGRFEDAKSLLIKLQALEKDSLTELGKQMVHLPVEPRLARWLLTADRYHCLQDAALLAAFLSEAPYRRSMRNMFNGPDLYEDFKLLKKNIRKPEFIYLKKTANDILENAKLLNLNTNYNENQNDEILRENLTKSMLMAYPDRLSQPRPQKEKLAESDPRRLILPINACMSGNRGVVIKEAQTLKDAKYFIAADLDLVRGKERAASTVVKAIQVDPAWIPWNEGITARYEHDKDRVVIAQAVYFDIFTLRETFLHDEKYHELRTQTLLEAAQKAPQKALNFESESWKQLMARLQFIQKLDSTLEIPNFDENWATSLLPELCKKASSFSELHEINLTNVAKQYIPYQTQAALNTLAPERVTLENGYETTVDYIPNPPVIAVKIQKAFGTYQVPKVGSVPVMIHLCAPNGRPAQVTQDLESFWKTTYSEVRKILRGRYPKHEWPENPPERK